jgi:hypothetical protein
LAARIAATVVGVYEAHADVAPGVGDPQPPEPPAPPPEVLDVVAPLSLDDTLLDEPPAPAETSPPPHPTAVSTSDSDVDAARRRSSPKVMFEEVIQITLSI